MFLILTQGKDAKVSRVGGMFEKIMSKSIPSNISHIEQMLTQRGERVLLVETSGLEDFEYVRAFYRKSGYEEEARIREFYKAGDDKIIFRKALESISAL